jgi:hypothetical protein
MADEMQDPRIAAMRDKMLAYRNQQQGMADQYQGGLSLPEQMPQQDPGADNQMMRNMLMNRQAMQRPAQGMMQPQGFGRAPMAPSIQQQAMTQSNGVADPNAASGTPAQMPMSGQMNRRQMMGRRMGQRMGMQRPTQAGGDMANPNAPPIAGRSVSQF